MKKFILSSLLICITCPVNAKLDQHQESSLKKTQQLLRDPSQRIKAVNNSKDAQEAHQKALNLLGNQENVNKAYDMAAVMLRSITEEANGDPQKMKQILNNARSNPAALAERMPAEFKILLKQMAKDIESQNAPSRK